MQFKNEKLRKRLADQGEINKSTKKDTGQEVGVGGNVELDKDGFSCGIGWDAHGQVV